MNNSLSNILLLLSNLPDHDIYDVIAKYNVLFKRKHYYFRYHLNDNSFLKIRIDLNCRFIFIMTIGIKI